MIAVREFTSAAECIAHAQAVRRKFFAQQKSQKPAIVETEPVQEQEIKPKYRMVIPAWYLENLPPLWARSEIRFDAHVQAWQWHVAQNASCKVKSYIDLRCKELGVTHDELASANRTRVLVYPRHLIWWELRKKFRVSLPKIGKMFGRRDHSTVYHGINKMEEFQKSIGGAGLSHKYLASIYSRAA